MLITEHLESKISKEKGGSIINNLISYGNNYYNFGVCPVCIFKQKWKRSVCVLWFLLLCYDYLSF